MINFQDFSLAEVWMDEDFTDGDRFKFSIILLSFLMEFWAIWNWRIILGWILWVILSGYLMDILRINFRDESGSGVGFNLAEV